MNIDTAAKPRAEAITYTVKGPFSAAEATRYYQMLFTFDYHLRFIHHLGAVAEGHCQLVDVENGIPRGFAACNAANVIAGLGALQRVDRHHQRSDPPRASIPVRKSRIIVNQPAECALHDSESRCRLHHLPQRHAAIEEFRRA